MENVRVKDNGKVFPSYEDWIRDHFYAQLPNWKRGTEPDEGAVYEKIGEVGKICLIKDPFTGQVYIIGKEGLEYVGGDAQIKRIDDKKCGYTASWDFEKGFFHQYIPSRYIINKNATILFWFDGSKTIVKRSKDDAYDKRLGFLTAYFQKHCGMSKNKANKYLDSLEEEE